MKFWCLLSGILCCGGSLDTSIAREIKQEPAETRYWAGIITVRPAADRESRKSDAGAEPVDSESRGWQDSTDRPPLVVRRVMDDSPAMRAGLSPGDVLMELDGAPLLSHVELVAAVQATGGQSATLRIDRGGQFLLLELQPIVRPADYVERVLRDRESERALATEATAGRGTSVGELPNNLADLLALAARREATRGTAPGASRGSEVSGLSAEMQAESAEVAGANAASGGFGGQSQREVNFDRSTRLLINKLDEFAAEWTELLRRQQETLRQLSGQF